MGITMGITMGVTIGGVSRATRSGEPTLFFFAAGFDDPAFGVEDEFNVSGVGGNDDLVLYHVSASEAFGFLNAAPGTCRRSNGCWKCVNRNRLFVFDERAVRSIEQIAADVAVYTFDLVDQLAVVLLGVRADDSCVRIRVFKGILDRLGQLRCLGPFVVVVFFGGLVVVRFVRFADLVIIVGHADFIIVVVFLRHCGCLRILDANAFAIVFHAFIAVTADEECRDQDDRKAQDRECTKCSQEVWSHLISMFE